MQILEKNVDQFCRNPYISQMIRFIQINLFTNFPTALDRRSQNI